MMIRSMSRTVLLPLMAVAVSACGGGGGGAGTTAGIDRTGSPVDALSVGTVTGFGSIHVNGIHFETTTTQFTIDGQPGTQEDLSVGDVVIVRGQLDADDSSQGTADEVVFDDNVEGPIADGSIDLAQNSFVVLGQTIRVSAETSFDDSITPRDLEGLSVGDVVEVSGLVGSDGSVSATRIERSSGAGGYEVTGIVTNLDSASSSFMINALTVDFSQASLIEDFPGGVIGAGDLVEVKGSMLSNSGALIATRVEFQGDRFAGAADDRIEIEGFITRFASPSDFDVSGLPVLTTSSTVYEGGSPGDLGQDIKVEVEGALNSAGVLVATKIDIRRSKAIRIEAVVDSVDAARDLLVVLGITVTVDSLTRMEDKSDLRVEPFTLSDIFAGDYVEVRGVEFPAGSGIVTAGLLERDDVDTDTELQGFVDSSAQPTLTILGVTINAAAGAVYRDASGGEISADEFFAAIDAAPSPVLVKASGVENAAGALDADELEFENE